MNCPHCGKEIETREVLRKRLDAKLNDLQQLTLADSEYEAKALKLATEIHETSQRLKTKDYYV